jgi:hypothetical protein
MTAAGVITSANLPLAPKISKWGPKLQSSEYHTVMGGFVTQLAETGCSDTAQMGMLYALQVSIVLKAIQNAIHTAS